MFIDDIWAIIQLKYFQPQLHKRGSEGPDLQRCWQLLKLTSRSFAAVIEQLHPEMRNAMMIFYLVLRGLDTIEDDTGLDLDVKLPLLASFRQKVLPRKDWTFNQSSPTEKDRVVLMEFDVVLREFHNLRSEYQDVIADITETMGRGMVHYADIGTQQNFEGLKTIKDYNQYCHYVAGIVGEGITRMALIAEFATAKLAENPELYDHMGLFLQKTNIIRDYREDIDDGRSFWPQEVWKKYAKSLSDFKTDHVSGAHCVSELTLLSLDHVTGCLEYLSNVKDQSLFRFCAIPQVMSIATLELVFNNPAIFVKHVKISKGTAARLILAATDMHAVSSIFKDYVRLIHQRNVPSDPNFLEIELTCSKIEQYINTNDLQGEAAASRREVMHPVYTRGFSFLRFTEDEVEGFKIFAAAGCMLISVMAVMMGVAYYFGARFPTPTQILRGELPPRPSSSLELK